MDLDNDDALVVARLRAELTEYAHSRRSDVARGAETPRLAAFIVEKYGLGMAKALHISNQRVSRAANLVELTDALVTDLDPNADTHRSARWAARPADIQM